METKNSRGARLSPRFLVILLLFLGHLSSPAGGLDFSSELALRSIPLGGALSAKVGYGIILWGNPSRKDNFLYGYLRPQLKLQSSGSVSIAELRMDVSPVAPLVFSFGHSDSYRATTFVDVDCVQNFCRGRLTRNYAQVAGILGRGPVFLGGIARITESRSPGHSGNFYDELFSLYGAAGTDQFSEWSAFVGTRLGENQSLGFLIENVLTKNNALESRLNQIFYEYKLKNWSFSTGAGTYESALQTRSPTVFVRIKWSGEKKPPGLL